MVNLLHSRPRSLLGSPLVSHLDSPQVSPLCSLLGSPQVNLRSNLRRSPLCSLLDSLPRSPPCSHLDNQRHSRLVSRRRNQVHFQLDNRVASLLCSRQASLLESLPGSLLRNPLPFQLGSLPVYLQGNRRRNQVHFQLDNRVASLLCSRQASLLESLPGSLLRNPLPFQLGSLPVYLQGNHRRNLVHYRLVNPQVNQRSLLGNLLHSQVHCHQGSQQVSPPTLLQTRLPCTTCLMLLSTKVCI